MKKMFIVIVGTVLCTTLLWIAFPFSLYSAFAVDNQSNGIIYFSIEKFMEAIVGKENFVLEEITPFKWDTVYIYCRPLDWTMDNPLDLGRLRNICPSFTIDDNDSLIIYENQGNIVGYTIYPACSALEFMDYDGTSILSNVSIRRDDAKFRPCIVFDEELKVNVVHCVLISKPED